jgi:hypothetical protein
MAKKKLKQKSIKELKAQQDRLTEKIKKAKEAGDTDKVKSLRAKKKKVTGAIARKRDIKAKREERETAETTEDLGGVLNSEAMSLLSETQQEALKAAIELYDPGTAPAELTEEELELIADEAAAIVDPYYDKKRDDITRDYDIGLANELDNLKDSVDRAEEDLAILIEEGDNYAAEQKRTEIANLRAQIPEAEERLTEYVAYKQEYLERELAKASADLATTLGAADEDEARALRAQERNYIAGLKQLQETMTSRGYAFSSARLEEEEAAAEEYEDVVSATTSEYERAREEAKRRYDYITAATEAGVEYDIAEQQAKVQQDKLQQLLAAEQRLGTEQAALLAEELGLDTGALVGDIEGSIVRGTRLEQEAGALNLERLRKDAAERFHELYGADMGSIYREKERALEELEAGRLAETESIEQELEAQRQSATYL